MRTAEEHNSTTIVFSLFNVRLCKFTVGIKTFEAVSGTLFELNNSNICNDRMNINKLKIEPWGCFCQTVRVKNIRLKNLLIWYLVRQFKE